jgi:hypothetical protein
MSTQTIPINTDVNVAYRHARINYLERKLAGNVAQASEPKPAAIPGKLNYPGAIVKYPATPADIAEWGIARQAEYFAVKSNRFISIKLDGETKERKVPNPLYLAWLNSQKVTVKTQDVVINPDNVQPVRIPTKGMPELHIEPPNAGTAREVSERFTINTGSVAHRQLSEPIAAVTEDPETGAIAVKVLEAPKGQRGLLAPQKPGESFEAFQARLREGYAIRAENARKYRAKLQGKVYDAAESNVRNNGVDTHTAVVQALSNPEVIPAKVGTGLRDEIMASLAHTFPKGFSSATGRIRRPTDRWKDGRLVAAVKGSQYQALWSVPASVPVTLVSFRVDYHPETGRKLVTCLPRDGRPSKSLYVRELTGRILRSNGASELKERTKGRFTVIGGSHVATVNRVPHTEVSSGKDVQATQAERMDSAEVRAKRKQPGNNSAMVRAEMVKHSRTLLAIYHPEVHSQLIQQANRTYAYDEPIGPIPCPYTTDVDVYSLYSAPFSRIR